MDLSLSEGLLDMLGNLLTRPVLGKYIFLPITILVTFFANEKTGSQRSEITFHGVFSETRKCDIIKSYRKFLLEKIILIMHIST